MKNAELLKMWEDLEDANPAAVIQPMTSGHEGSTYGEDGIRIDGSEAFIRAVLSKLKDLLVLENNCTRLAASYNEIAERRKTATGVEFGGGTGRYCCYIRAALRGGDGAASSWVFDQHWHGRTKEFARLQGHGDVFEG